MVVVRSSSQQRCTTRTDSHCVKLCTLSRFESTQWQPTVPEHPTCAAIGRGRLPVCGCRALALPPTRACARAAHPRADCVQIASSHTASVQISADEPVCHRATVQEGQGAHIRHVARHHHQRCVAGRQALKAGQSQVRGPLSASVLVLRAHCLWNRGLHQVCMPTNACSSTITWVDKRERTICHAYIAERRDPEEIIVVAIASILA